MWLHKIQNEICEFTKFKTKYVISQNYIVSAWIHKDITRIVNLQRHLVAKWRSIAKVAEEQEQEQEEQQFSNFKDRRGNLAVKKG